MALPRPAPPIWPNRCWPGCRNRATATESGPGPGWFHPWARPASPRPVAITNPVTTRKGVRCVHVLVGALSLAAAAVFFVAISWTWLDVQEMSAQGPQQVARQRVTISIADRAAAAMEPGADLISNKATGAGRTAPRVGVLPGADLGRQVQGDHAVGRRRGHRHVLPGQPGRRQHPVRDGHDGVRPGRLGEGERRPGWASAVGPGRARPCAWRRGSPRSR